MRAHWKQMKAAIVVFVLITVGINMLAMGYIAMRAQREVGETQEECHQLEDLIKLINERLPVRPPP
jgi:hypothetical protein